MTCFADDLADWQQLSRIRGGEKVRVVRQDMKTVDGLFESFSVDAIVVRQDSGSARIPKSDVVRVTITSRGHRLRNSLIGAGAGAAVGYGIGRAGTSRWNGGWEAVAALSAIVGAGGGAGLGATIPGHPTVYRSGTPIARTK